MDAYKALAEGYICTNTNRLQAYRAEVDYMATAARIVTFTQGLRFLADHLAGDVYYRTGRKNHNLDRARTQFKMVSEMEERKDVMEKIVGEIWRRTKEDRNRVREGTKVTKKGEQVDTPCCCRIS